MRIDLKRSVMLSLCSAALLVISACGRSNGDLAGLSSAGYPNPTVENPPDVGKPFVAGTTFSLSQFGYEEQEYFYSGTAYSYVNDAPLTSDGKWSVSPADQASYKTRMLVFRPIDAGSFNGTVVVEWLNDTAGVDTAAEWVTMHTELLRSGYAWVGISAQQIGIEGGKPPLATPLPFAVSLKLINAKRYGSLSHPGDSFSYDIFAQAAQAIRHPRGIAPLGGLAVQRLIAAGESQSATRLNTYLNAFGTQTDLFDGYFIHSRLGLIPEFGGASAPLSQTPQAVINTPPVVQFRTDLGKPLMDLQTETDMFVLGAYSSAQEDSDLIRIWEVAGTSHADYYISKGGFSDTGQVPAAEIYDTDRPAPIGSACPQSINSAPQHHFVANAAMHALNLWLVNAVVPPSAPRITVTADGTAIVRDSQGIALGGVRTPYVDVPTALLTGENSSTQADNTICFLYGRTALFDAATLLGFYPDHDSYVTAVTASAQSAVNQGFLLSEDAQLIVEAAQQSTDP